MKQFPRHPLTFGPSPVHPLDRLTDHLGGAAVWAKREDVNCGLAFGGNKIRKLEYIVPDVLASGADTLVSIGGVQSNHTRQVAAVAAHLGLKCRLVQEKWVRLGRPGQRQGRQHPALPDHGRRRPPRPAGFDIGIRRSWEDAIARGRGGGRHAVRDPGRAPREHPLGGLGFANWAFEVAEQEQALGVHFDTIVVCTVTGSTHAGMIAGFAALEDGRRPRRVLGIDASATLEKTRDQVARIARHTAELIELGRDLRDDEITVLEGWAGDLYGIPVESTIEAIRLSGRLEGDDHRPGLRGEVDGRADRPRRARARSARTPPCSTPTWADSPR